MLFLWNAQPPKTASAPPVISAELQRFFAAVAPRDPILPAPAKPPLSHTPGLAMPLPYAGETTHNVAELRIRQWLLQREREALLERQKRLYPPLPTRK